MEMRKKSQPWLVPLLVLLTVLWLMGKKDETPTQQRTPTAQTTPSSFVSSHSPVPEAATATAPPDQFVSADKLNLRDSPGGKVVSTLKRGDKVQVFEKQKEWVRVSTNGQPDRWLSSKSLCSGANCYIASKQSRPTQPASLPKPSRQQSPSYGSSCPCSSGNICIGPRGGRYCITSGGNKRYGV